MSRSAVLVGCAAWVLCAPGARSQEAGEVEFEERSVTLPGGERLDYEVGTLYVPEHRADPGSRVIGVGFAWLPALDPESDAPPTFHLPGGPGSSFVERLESRNAQERAQTLESLAIFRAAGEVVLVDQRGFSRRGDVLMMRFRQPARDPRQPPTSEDQARGFAELARQVSAEYEDGEVDLRGYTVLECADDVRDLADALGYPVITLVGTSFGSQWSFAVMRRHPDYVARALLSGVEPLDHAYDMPSDVFGAARRMWWSLEQDPTWQPFLPPGGIAAAAESVIARLERGELELELGDQRVLLGPGDFPWRDPAQILALHRGHTEVLAPSVQGQLAGGGQRSLPLIGPLIDSSLAVTPQRRHRLWTDPATRYLGRDNFAMYLESAEIWPSPDVGDEFRTPQLCDIPVVFAQGDWDLSTPLENTLEIAPYFPNSRVLIAERGGHGVIGPIARELPEVWESLEEFLRSGDMSGIPARVTLRGQGFALPRFER